MGMTPEQIADAQNEARQYMIKRFSTDAHDAAALANSAMTIIIERSEDLEISPIIGLVMLRELCVQNINEYRKNRGAEIPKELVDAAGGETLDNAFVEMEKMILAGMRCDKKVRG